MVAAIQNGNYYQNYQQPQQAPPQQQPYIPGVTPGQYQQQGQGNQGDLNPSIANQQALWLAQQAQQSSGLTHQQQFYHVPNPAPLPQPAQQLPSIQEAIRALSPYINSLEQMAQVAGAQAIYIEGVQGQLKEYHRIAEIGYVAIQSLHDVLNQLKATEELHNALLNCVNSPDWMLVNSFDVMANAITGNDDAAMEVVSQKYLEFASAFEEKKRQLTGSYSPGYTAYLNENINAQNTSNSGNQQPSQQQYYQSMRELSRVGNGYQASPDLVGGIKALSARLNQRPF